MNELYTLTMKKKQNLMALGLNYVCIWEHEWNALKAEAEVKSYLSTLDLQPRLDPRDSFYGWRLVLANMYFCIEYHDEYLMIFGSCQWESNPTSQISLYIFRTNCTRLHYKVKDDEQIKYMDFCR